MSLSSLKVMVVEDHGFQRRVALRLLADLGIENCLEAADGQEALDKLNALPGPIDVVIVDLDMPGMDGVEFIGHVSESRLAQAIVVASAMDAALLNTVEAMAQAFGLRVLGSVEKPLTVGKLAAVLSAFEEAGEAPLPESPVEVSTDDLVRALDREEFVPWFQPQAEFFNGKVVGVEALARWRRPDGEYVPPGRFIQLLERDGLADRFTASLLGTACRHKKRWEGEGLRVTLSVNISPSCLAAPGTADLYQQIVNQHGVDPSEVVLEITESSVMSDTGQSLSALARLRLKGFGLAIDDFGTGYSSLAQLSQVPFTELKVDQGFVTGAHAQPRKRAVIEASLDLARKLDLVVVAEGVESTEDWQMLAELGCDLAQGTLVSTPVPGEKLVDAVARWRRPTD